MASAGPTDPPAPAGLAADPLDFSGKIALVTGAARGIGRGVADALAMRGAKVILLDRAFDAAAAGGEVQVACDVTDPDAVTQAAGVVQEAGGFDILVNNAGVLRDRTLKKMSRAEWDAVLAVNLTGTFAVTQAMAPHLRPGGAVVNMASVAGTLGFFGQANYAASKAGVIAFTKVAARELAWSDVRVNAVAPGFIRTHMTASMPQAVVDDFTKQIPMNRWGEVDDVVGAVLFLCSDLARYVTGQVLHVNGGFYTGTA